MNEKESDKNLIICLGGSSAVARMIGLDPKKGGTQRVQNWKSRGIPAAIKLKYPKLFIKKNKMHKLKNETSYTIVNT